MSSSVSMLMEDEKVGWSSWSGNTLKRLRIFVRPHRPTLPLFFFYFTKPTPSSFFFHNFACTELLALFFSLLQEADSFFFFLLRSLQPTSSFKKHQAKTPSSQFDSLPRCPMTGSTPHTHKYHDVGVGC